MSRSGTKRSTQAREVGIMECHASHAAALEKLGATASQLDDLRRAADAVVAAERSARSSRCDPLRASASVTIRALACTVPAATKEMRAWARTAMEAVTGGATPASGQGQAMALLAGAWALREVADGRADEVMRATSAKGAMAAIVGELLAALRESDSDFNRSLSMLAEDYARAMGFLMPPPMAGAIEGYHRQFESICLEIVRRPLSRRASRPQSCSGSVGKPTGAGSRRRSSMRGSNARSGGSQRGSRR